MLKMTRKLLVKGCCSCPEDEQIKDVRDNQRKTYLDYKTTHRAVSQENCWQVRGLSVLPCHLWHSQTSPAEESWAPALTRHCYFWDPHVSVSITSPVTMSWCILRTRYTHTLRGSQLEEVSCAAPIQLPASIYQLLYLWLCYGLQVRKGWSFALWGAEPSLKYDTVTKYLLLGSFLMPWCWFYGCRWWTLPWKGVCWEREILCRLLGR